MSLTRTMNCILILQFQVVFLHDVVEESSIGGMHLRQRFFDLRVRDMSER